MKYLLMLLLSLSVYAQQVREPVNVGAVANDGTGDPLRQAYQKLNTNDFKLWRSVYTNAPVNVKDFGAVGDGVTDDTGAFSNALASVTSKGVVLVPQGTYKLTSGLTINVTKVRVSGWNAKLDFSSLATNATGITITGTGGGVGAPYYQADGGLSGLEIQGPGQSGTSIGVLFNTPTEPGPSHTTYKNIVIHGFNTGVSFLSQSYLLTFDNVDIHGCETGVIHDPATNNGEALRFIGGVIYNNSGYAIRMRSIHGFVKLIGTSVDYNFGGIEITRGRLDLLGAHFEGVVGQHIVVPAGNEAGVMPIVNMHGGILYRGYTSNAPNQDSTNSMVDIRGRASVTIVGTEIHDYVAQVPKIYLSNVSSLFIFGGRMIYNPAYPMIESYGNATIACWDWNGGILESAGLYSKNVITAANSIIATNQLVGGSVRSLGGGEFANTVYATGVYVTNNLVANGNAFLTANATVSSNLTVNQAITAGSLSAFTNVSAGGNIIAGNQVQGGSVHSLGNISAASTVYTTGLYATNNIVGIGPGFFNSTLQVTSNLTALASVNASEKLTAGTSVEAASYVQAKNGIFKNNDNTVTCTVLNTWYNVGTGQAGGLYLFRDQTSGGVALIMADTSAVATITNAITGLEFRYDGGTTNMQIRVTSGTAPRSIRRTFVQTNEL